MVLLLFTISVAAFSHVAHPSWYPLHCTRWGRTKNSLLYATLITLRFVCRTWILLVSLANMIHSCKECTRCRNNNAVWLNGEQQQRRWWWWCLYGSQQSLEGYMNVYGPQHNSTAQQWKDEKDLPIPIAHSICLLFVPNEPFPIPFHNCIFSARDCIDTGHGEDDIIAHPRLSLLSCTFGKEMAVQKDFRPKEIQTSGERITFANRSFVWSFAINFPQYVYIWAMMIWYGWICCGWIHFDWEGTLYTERLLYHVRAVKAFNAVQSTLR